jgi:hypothetical protein
MTGQEHSALKKEERMGNRSTGSELGIMLVWLNEFAAAIGRPGFDRAEGRCVLRAYDTLQRAFPKNTDQYHTGGIPKLESIYREADRLRTEVAAAKAQAEAVPAIA